MQVALRIRRRLVDILPYSQVTVQEVCCLLPGIEIELDADKQVVRVYRQFGAEVVG